MSKPVTRGSAYRVTLYPVKQCPEIARTFVRHRLLSFDITMEKVDDGCLITSEQNHPLLEIWDPSHEIPLLVVLPHEDFGRGPHIVNNLSAQWGYYFPASNEGGGKVVWARLI